MNDPARKRQASQVAPTPGESGTWCLAIKQGTGTTDCLPAMAWGLLLPLKLASGLILVHRVEREREREKYNPEKPLKACTALP